VAAICEFGTLLTSGCADADLKRFVWDLAKEGFVLQLVSLAGLHSNAVSFGASSFDFGCSICDVQTAWATAELAQRFKTDGMLAYVETVQRKEKETGCDVLMHQRWYALRSHPPVPFLDHRAFFTSFAVQEWRRLY
jgi:isocitrate lyase